MLFLFILWASIPTTPLLWQQCCEERDCNEAQVEVLTRGEQMSTVRIDGQTVEVLTGRIHPSMTGREYYCVLDGGELGEDELMCVFHASPLAKGYA